MKIQSIGGTLLGTNNYIVGNEKEVVLIEAKKGAKPGLIIKQPLILNNDDGTESDELKKIYCRKS